MARESLIQEIAKSKITVMWNQLPNASVLEQKKQQVAALKEKIEASVTGVVVDSHTPQLTGNGGLLVIKIDNITVTTIIIIGIIVNSILSSVFNHKGNC